MMVYVPMLRIVIVFLSIVLCEATYAQGEKVSYTPLQTIRKHAFIKGTFHHLNVPTVGIFTVYDVFDCTFECLSNPKCFSVNLAASKGANGEHWCELLSSDKYRNFTEYKGNKTSHHYYINSPCSSSPCQNGGACSTDYNYGTFSCVCKNNSIGKYCEKVATSCKELYDEHKSDVSQLFTLLLDSKPTSVLCQFGDFGCGDGGWTPVMKIDGSKGTFHYNSGYWSNKTEYNLPGGETGFDTQEIMLPSYWNTSFTKICLGMKIGPQMNFIVINKQANSLYSLIADGQYRATSLGRNTWKTLIGSQALLQANCSKEGFNAVSSNIYHSKARVGILGNNEDDCFRCDSRIGFGTGGIPDDSNTCGNVAAWTGGNGQTYTKTMGYILIQ